MINSCHAEGLGAWDQVGCYCERALNPDFWAEPINAMSNLAFLFTALFAYTDLRAKGPHQGTREIIVLIGLMMAVGVGSFMFHTFATGWARLADVTPVSLFITLFLVIALRQFLGMSLLSALGISGLVVGVTLVMFLCGGILPDRLCVLLNTSFSGSLPYLPALAVMAVFGTVLYQRKHPVTDWVLSALCVYAVSLIFRSLDSWPHGNAIGCMTREMGEKTISIGTHSIWHILNAVMLYLLLRALIENLPSNASQAPKQ
jgi:hypothetical protein